MYIGFPGGHCQVLSARNLSNLTRISLTLQRISSLTVWRTCHSRITDVFARILKENAMIGRTCERAVAVCIAVHAVKAVRLSVRPQRWVLVHSEPAGGPDGVEQDQVVVGET